MHPAQFDTKGAGIHAPRAGDIRIASVPCGHVYVQHLNPVTAPAGFVQLPDPRTTRLANGIVKWWPPPMLTTDWITKHLTDFDVFHVQFGFDALSTGQLASVIETLDRAGKPLVYTVHDLRNPHHTDPRAHDEHLELLIPAATALITLTNGAAEVIEHRWGRRPTVLPHPHVVELQHIRPRPAAPTGRFTVGVHAKSLRASMDPAAVVGALLPLNAELPGFILQVNIHRDVFEADGARHDRQLATILSAAADNGALELFVHDCYSDAELWRYLRSLDVSVLPYRFGTHSGWLEACFDLGTTVVAPSCGFYAQQQPCLTYQHNEQGLDEDSLRDAVRRAYLNRPIWQATRTGRRHQRDELAEAHHTLYREILG
jgi:hypothetical protein